jgi:hypothetical protein
MVANFAYRVGRYRRAYPACAALAYDYILSVQTDSLDIQGLVVAYIRAIPTNQNDSRENQGKTAVNKFFSDNPALYRCATVRRGVSK